ncbi:MAG: DUF4249 domain-containing protein [Saprospiraceae bacterium]|nr:DUF4249 domain-containing protein [Saprospiraceae bacterium]
MNRKLTLLFSTLSILITLVACEQEWENMPTAFDEPEIVVEGYIENGPLPIPPYVILTRSSPYLATLDQNALNDLLIHDAEVTVSDGTREVTLTEICLSDLWEIDSTLKEPVLQGLGLGELTEGEEDLELCVYTDLSILSGQPSMTGEIGKTYTLNVTVGGQSVTATTKVPDAVPLDSVYYLNHPSFPENDSLVETRLQFQDPVSVENYYRVFTRRNSEMMYPQGFNASVADDKIVDGQVVEFPVSRGQPITSEFDLETFGYFWRGDTVTVRFATLDQPHFRFWQTYEYNTGSQGPFGSYVRIESNVEGGLGIWGGITYNDYFLFIEE